jgi:hypothetical protein
MLLQMFKLLIVTGLITCLKIKQFSKLLFGLFIALILQILSSIITDTESYPEFYSAWRKVWKLIKKNYILLQKSIN